MEAVPSTQERTQGLNSGEVFVRLNGANLCEPQGTLHGIHPFLVKLLRLEDENSAVQSLVHPVEAKLELTRDIRRQIRQRKCAAKRRWDAVRETVNVLDNGRMGTLAHFSPVANSASAALDHFVQQFQRLEQVYKKYVTSDILQLYALLEAESQYITAWSKREEAKCKDQRSLTKLLHQFNSFALQLESETSGQVRMWRLPSSDPQRIRCVKAATENIKKGFLSSSEALEALEVYKIDNRVLLNNFQRFTNLLAKNTPDIKIKGLFCSVPVESVERCVVYGMNTSQDDEPRFFDPQGAEIKIFNRSLLLQNREGAPGTNMMFRARSKVSSGTSLQFPRRFSRYSTLEEMRTVTTAVEGQTSPVLFLGLCRVAMGKSMRVKDKSGVKFPDDSSVCALHFTNEEEYLVRYPDAVVPEFFIQFRVKRASTVIPVSQSPMTSVPIFGSDAFQDFIYSAAFESPSLSISAFPLALPQPNHQHSFFTSIDRQSNSTARSGSDQKHEAKEAEDLPPEIVLDKYSRLKTQLREDLQRLERLFWSRAREIWEEEGLRRGVKIQRDSQLQNSPDNVHARVQLLRGELDSLRQIQFFDPPSNIRPKRQTQSARRRR